MLLEGAALLILGAVLGVLLSRRNTRLSDFAQNVIARIERRRSDHHPGFVTFAEVPKPGDVIVVQSLDPDKPTWYSEIRPDEQDERKRA